MNTLLRILLIAFLADKVSKKKKPKKKNYEQKQDFKVTKVKGEAKFTEDINLN